MSKKSIVLIVEPSFIVTEGLTRILKKSTDFDILTPLNDIENLKETVPTLHPDILILNPTLLPYSKHGAIYTIQQDNAHMAVVALVYQYIESTMLKSFHGILDIRETPERIPEILQESLTAAETHKNTTIENNNTELTNREIDVLILVAKGLMSKEIADKLNISVHTVITHRKNITHKTNIKSVAGLAMYALMNNLIEEGDVI